MTNAKHDDNHVATAIGTLQSDSVSIVPMRVNPTNNSIKVVDDTTGSFTSPKNAGRDDNHVPVLMGVSSVDMTTPTAIAFDANGNMLIQST